VARNCRRDDMSRITQAFAHAHPAQLRDADAFIFNLELVVGDLKTVVTAFSAEPRVAGKLVEKIVERLTQLDDCHLWRVLGHLQHPGIGTALDRVELAAQCGLARPCQRSICFGKIVLALPFTKRPVVGEARNASSFRQARCLHVVGFEADAVGKEHCASLFGVKENRRDYSSAMLALLSPSVLAGLNSPLFSQKRNMLVETPNPFAAALMGMGWFILDMTSHD
jgi:hypothetical protein